MTPTLLLMSLTPNALAEPVALDVPLEGFRRHQPSDDDGPATCVTLCSPRPDKRTDFNLTTSRGTLAVNGSVLLTSGGSTSVYAYGEAGFLPTLSGWTTMAGGGAVVTVGGSSLGHLEASASVWTQREADWRGDPTRTVDTELAVAVHLNTQPDVTWEVIGRVDPYESLTTDTFDGSVAVTRTRAPWEGTWHDVRFTVGFELRDSSGTQAWVDKRWDEPVDLPEVLPYPTIGVTWAF